MESLFASKWFYLPWKSGPEENPLRCCTDKLNCSLWNDHSFIFFLTWKKKKSPLQDRDGFVFSEAFPFYSKNP